MALDVLRFWIDKYVNTFDEEESKREFSFSKLFKEIRNALDSADLNSLSALKGIKDILYNLNGQLEDCLQPSEGLRMRKMTTLLTEKKRNETMKKNLRDVLRQLQDWNDTRVSADSSSVSAHKPFSIPFISHTVHGFQKQYNDITRLLLGHNESDKHKMQAVGIVGMGGSGKTTLASMVFNCTQIQETFSVMIWVSLTRTLNRKECTRANIFMDMLRGVQNYSVFKQMLEKLEKDHVRNDSKSQILDSCISQFKQFLNGKKYIIVLDDVWDTKTWYGESEDKCVLSREWIEQNGGTIVVTSRLKEMAKSVVGEENLYSIKPISADACWSIFADRIEKDEITTIHDPIIVGMRDEIKEKCNGLPLAALTLGDIIPKQIQLRKKENKASEDKIRKQEKDSREELQLDASAIEDSNNMQMKEQREEKNEKGEKEEIEKKEEELPLPTHLTEDFSDDQMEKEREEKNERGEKEEIKEKKEEPPSAAVATEDISEDQMEKGREEKNEREEKEETKEKKQEPPAAAGATKDSTNTQMEDGEAKKDEDANTS